MPAQLYRDDRVSFICGRNFIYNGTKYTVGDEFPQDRLVSDPEVMVRSRHLIPVVDEGSDKPRTFHREVQIRDVVLAKLGKTGEVPDEAVIEEPEEEEEEGPFDPDEHTVDEVLDYLTSDDIEDDETERVLDAERKGKQRKGILGDED